MSGPKITDEFQKQVHPNTDDPIEKSTIIVSQFDGRLQKKTEHQYQYFEALVYPAGKINFWEFDYSTNNVMDESGHPVSERFLALTDRPSPLQKPDYMQITNYKKFDDDPGYKRRVSHEELYRAIGIKIASDPGLEDLLLRSTKDIMPDRPPPAYKYVHAKRFFDLSLAAHKSPAQMLQALDKRANILSCIGLLTSKENEYLKEIQAISPNLDYKIQATKIALYHLSAHGNNIETMPEIYHFKNMACEMDSAAGPAPKSRRTGLLLGK